MKVVPSAVTGVAVHGPDSPAFNDGLAAIPGHTRDLLQPAIPFSVIVENNSTRTITLVGVRFDMAGPGGKHYSVVHYADALRFPQHADFSPGTRRFVCAEPAYTALVVRGEIPVPARTRGRMNLENLGRMLEIRASLDCIAFDDGEFGGPDSQGAFARLAREREPALSKPCWPTHSPMRMKGRGGNSPASCSRRLNRADAIKCSRAPKDSSAASPSGADFRAGCGNSGVY
jgi:hypothetical protein